MIDYQDVIVLKGMKTELILDGQRAEWVWQNTGEYLAIIEHRPRREDKEPWVIFDAKSEVAGSFPCLVTAIKTMFDMEKGLSRVMVECRERSKEFERRRAEVKRKSDLEFARRRVVDAEAALLTAEAKFLDLLAAGGGE